MSDLARHQSVVRPYEEEMGFVGHDIVIVLCSGIMKAFTSEQIG